MAHRNPIRSFGVLLGGATLLGVVHALAELLFSSASQLLPCGDAADRLQVLAGFAAYPIIFFSVGAVLWGGLRLSVRRAWVDSYGPTLCVTMGALAAVKTLWILGDSPGYFQEVVTLLIFLGVGVVAVLLNALSAMTPGRFALVWLIACMGGLAGLCCASRVFFLHGDRPLVAGAVAVLDTVGVGLFGMVLGTVLRRKNTSALTLAALVTFAAALLPTILGVVRLVPYRPSQSFARQLVVVTCDALRADYCSLHGGAVPTPNLEALGAEGAVFESYYSLAPWTVPSLCGMYASRYPMSMNPGASYDEWLAVLGAQAHAMAYWLDDDGRSFPERLTGRGIATAAFLANPLLGREQWLVRGFSRKVVVDFLAEERCGPLWRFHSLHAVLGRFCPSVRRVRPCDSTRILTQYAIEYIRRQRNRSFFLWIHLMDPHAPYDPPKRYRTEQGRWLLFCPTKPEYGSVGLEAVKSGALDEQDRAFVRSLYEGAVRYADEAVGQIHRAMKRLPEGTARFLCVTADHGEELWDRGRWGHGQSLYDEQVHVPLILWGADIPPNRIAVPVSGIDVLPTLAELISVSPRSEWRGTSLVPCLRETNVPPHARPCFVQGTSFSSNPKRAVVSANHKLIQDLPTGDTALFDLAADPLERVDISADEPQRAAALETRLEEWAGSFPSLIGDFTRKGIDDKAADESREQMEAVGYL